MLGELHRFHGKLNIYAAPYFAAAGRVEVLLRCLHNNRIAVIIEPIDQRPDRDFLVIFNDNGVVERAHDRATALKLLEKALVVDFEAKGLWRLSGDWPHQ